MLSKSVAASPPGKSARAEPPSGMKSVSRQTPHCRPHAPCRQAYDQGMHRKRRHCPDGVSIPILEELIELRAVTLELGALVEDFPEGLLHRHDPLADATLPPSFS